MSNFKASIDTVKKCLLKYGCTDWVYLNYFPFIEEITIILQEEKRISALSVNNARSAGFYLLGKELNNQHSVLILDDKHRDLDSLMSPLNEAYYQSIKLILVQITDDTSTNNSILYETIDIDLVEGKDHEGEELFQIIQTANSSLLIRLHGGKQFLFTQNKRNICDYNQEVLLSFLANDISEDTVITVSTQYFDNEHQKLLQKAHENTTILSDIGYGVVSYFAGRSCASPGNNHLLVIDSHSFFDDMNALCIRGFKQTSSNIIITTRDIRDADKCFAWAKNLGIKTIDNLREFNQSNEMSVCCIVY